MAKYDSHWWFGKNSIWAASGAKEAYTGLKSEGKKKFFGDFKVPMQIDLSDDMKLGAIVIGGIVIYSLLVR